MIYLIMIIFGVLLLVLPKDKLVKKEKLSDEKAAEKSLKIIRISGIVFIVAGIILFLTNL